MRLLKEAVTSATPVSFSAEVAPAKFTSEVLRLQVERLQAMKPKNSRKLQANPKRRKLTIESTALLMLLARLHRILETPHRGDLESLKTDIMYAEILNPIPYPY